MWVPSFGSNLQPQQEPTEEITQINFNIIHLHDVNVQKLKSTDLQLQAQPQWQAQENGAFVEISDYQASTQSTAAATNATADNTGSTQDGKLSRVRAAAHSTRWTCSAHCG